MEQKAASAARGDDDASRRPAGPGDTVEATADAALQAVDRLAPGVEMHERPVRARRRPGLLGDGFAVDASLIKADANRKGIEGDKGLPPAAAGRAIDEYLAVLDDAAFGAATEVTPKFVSPSDPAARWTAHTAAKPSSPT